MVRVYTDSILFSFVAFIARSGPDPANRLLASFLFVRRHLKDRVASLGMTCGQRVEFPNRYRPSKPGFPQQISNYTNSLRCWVALIESFSLAGD